MISQKKQKKVNEGGGYTMVISLANEQKVIIYNIQARKRERSVVDCALAG